MAKKKNTFSIHGDYTPYEVVDAINFILTESFGIQIECISPDDDEEDPSEETYISEYEISIIKPK